MRDEVFKWEGIHPRQWLFGWVVASPPAAARFRRRYRRFTRQGAEHLAKRLNRRKERQERALIKSGMLTGYDRFSVLGRIGEHPLRSPWPRFLMNKTVSASSPSGAPSTDSPPGASRTDPRPDV
jgi:hypothetical protein